MLERELPVRAKFFPGIELKIPQRVAKSESSTPFASAVETEDAYVFKIGGEETLKRDRQHRVLGNVPVSDWDANGVMLFYQHMIDVMNESIDPSLVTAGRQVYFVPATELPLIRAKRKRRRERAVGDSLRLEDGRFRIRVGYDDHDLNNIDNIVDEILPILSHEHGHTLGEHIDDPIFEELKAFAFESLFMKEYGIADYNVGSDFSVGRHRVAGAFLGQLLGKGIPEQAIIAHLTGEHFGGMGPMDYLSMATS